MKNILRFGFGAFAVTLSFAQAAEIRVDLGKEQPGKPLKSQNPINRGRGIDPAIWQGRAEKDAAPPHGFDVCPGRLNFHLVREIAVGGDDRIWIPSENLFE